MSHAERLCKRLGHVIQGYRVKELLVGTRPFLGQQLLSFTPTVTECQVLMALCLSFSQHWTVHIFDIYNASGQWWRRTQ